MKLFNNLGIDTAVLKSIEELGFEEPMPVQEKVIPLVLETENDLIGLAQTGTGKTAAFGLPIIQLVNPNETHTQALILAPTRELCLQISGHMKSFAKHLSGINIVAVYGGADISRQIAALKRGAQIIVATPGRMNDLLNKRGKIDLSFLSMVVLDEADEMLSMGFKEELDAILDQTPEHRRTLLFSATMPAEVERLSNAYLFEPQIITIGTRNAGAEKIDHICYAVHSKDRYLALKRIVDYNPDIYGIVFCRTRAETKEVAEKLIHDGYNAEPLHGELSQPQRESIMQKFRARTVQLLVATDVAARGLDVKDITHIISYNLPDDNGVYTHRSGRTGRAGQTGVSIAIVNMRETYKIKQLESKLRKKFERKRVPGGQEICERQLLHMIDRMETIEINHKEIDKFLAVASEKLAWLSREELIKHFVSLEFNQLLEYYKDTKDLNPPEDNKMQKKRFQKEGPSFRSDRHTVEKGFARFHINLGYKDSFSPRDLIGLINRCTRTRIEVGRINVLKTFSIFEVKLNAEAAILAGFRGIEYNRRPVVVRPFQEKDERTSEQTSLSVQGERGRTDGRSRTQKHGPRRGEQRSRSAGQGRADGRGYSGGRNRSQTGNAGGTTTKRKPGHKRASGKKKSERY